MVVMNGVRLSACIVCFDTEIRVHASFWSAVAKMHGASLHRSYRFRGVLKSLRPEPVVRPEKVPPYPSPEWAA